MGLFKTLTSVIGATFGGPIGAFVGSNLGGMVEGESTVASGQASDGAAQDFISSAVDTGVKGFDLFSKSGSSKDAQPQQNVYTPSPRVVNMDSGFDLTRYTPKPIDPETGLPMFADGTDGKAIGEDILMVSRNSGKPVGVMNSNEAIVPATQPNLPEIKLQSDTKAPTVVGFANEQDKQDNFLAGQDLLKIASNVARLYATYRGAQEDTKRAQFGMGPGVTSRMLSAINDMEKSQVKPSNELTMYRSKKQIDKEFETKKEEPSFEEKERIKAKYREKDSPEDTYTKELLKVQDDAAADFIAIQSDKTKKKQLPKGIKTADDYIQFRVSQKFKGTEYEKFLPARTMEVDLPTGKMSFFGPEKSKVKLTVPPAEREKLNQAIEAINKNPLDPKAKKALQAILGRYGQ